MIDFENLDFSKIDLKQLAEEFKNLGKTLLSVEEVLRKVQAGESMAGTQLWNLDLSGADLRGANFEHAKFIKTRLLGANLEGARLSGAIFNEADLGQAKLSGADLSKVQMINTSCEKTVFRNANLSEMTAGIERMLLKNPGDFKPSQKVLELAGQDLSNIDFESLDLDLKDLGIAESDFNPGRSIMIGADFIF